MSQQAKDGGPSFDVTLTGKALVGSPPRPATSAAQAPALSPAARQVIRQTCLLPRPCFVGNATRSMRCELATLQVYQQLSGTMPVYDRPSTVPAMAMTSSIASAALALARSAQRSLPQSSSEHVCAAVLVCMQWFGICTLYHLSPPLSRCLSRRLSPSVSLVDLPLTCLFVCLFVLFGH